MKPRLLALAALLVAALASPGDVRSAPVPPKATSYATPQAAFDAAKSSFNKKDYKAFYATLSPSSAEVLAGQLVFMGAMFRSFAGSDKSGKFAEKYKALEPVLTKHGATKEAMDKLKDVGLVKDEAELQARMKKVAALVKDRSGFVVDTMVVMDKAGDLKDFPLIAAKLEDLEIKGDKATGNVVFKRGASEVRDPIEFVKVGGSWRMEMPSGRRGGPKKAPPPPPPAKFE